MGVNKHTWKPTQRNRNIGTAKQGLSQNNKFSIPDRWSHYGVYWEHLENPVLWPFEVNGHSMKMLIEPVRPGYLHSVTPHDIRQLLSLIEKQHLEEIELIVLRQPKKKEEIMQPVWGRFIYYAYLEKFSGPSIYLEAVKSGQVIKWSKKQDPFYMKELDALGKDGHVIKAAKRNFEISTSPDAVRNTQLFRSLPHEIGHAMDYLNNSIIPSAEAGSEEESDYIYESFKAKPFKDKEEYANRYAREFYEKWQRQGFLPFDRVVNEKELLEIGVELSWFIA